MKTKNVFLALVLALALCLSCLATTAFAAITDPAKGKEGTPDNPAQAAITKLLRLPVGTAVPEATFRFQVTSETVDGAAATAANMPLIGTDANVPGKVAGNVEIKYLGTETGTAITNNILTLPKEYNLFATTVWPHAGVYVYTVKEIAGTYAIADPNHEAMKYSAAEYTLRVYVKDGVKTNGEKVCYIFAIGAYATVKDDNGPAVEEKIIVTPGGGEDITLDYSQMIFSNNYAKTNGSVDPEDPDPTDPDEATLSVSKAVTGDFGSSTVYFRYELTVNTPNIVTAPALPTTFNAYIVEGSTIIGAADLADAAKNNATLGGTDKNGKAYITFTSGTAAMFSLKANQKLVFINTPVGTDYDVEEAGTTAYLASVNVTYDGAAGYYTNTGATLGAGVAANGQLVGEAANSADFTNKRDDVTPTGLNLNDLPFIGMIVLALGGIAAFAVVMARKRKRYN